MKIIYSEDSRKELFDIATFYKNIGIDVSKKFRDEIRRVENNILKTPEIYTTRHLNYRRVNLKNYPFCIFFKVDKTNIKIVKIIHQSRDPIFWP